MNPSYNGSFGSGYPGGQVPGGVNSGSFGGVPQGQPMSMGTGDIVLSSDGGGQRKSKKWILAIVGVMVVVALVAVGIMMVGNFGNKSGDQKANQEFHTSVQESRESANYLLGFIKSVYDGNVPLASFDVQSEDNYKEMNSALKDGVQSLNEINDLISNGKPLQGVSNEINLTENYQGLRDVLSVDIPKYEKLVSFTIAIVDAFRNENSNDGSLALSEYDVSNLTETIKTYLTENKKAISDYNANGCRDSQNEVCKTIFDELTRLQDVKKDTEIIQQSYMAVISDLKYSGEGSILYYLNNLYAGTETSDEE